MLNGAQALVWPVPTSGISSKSLDFGAKNTLIGRTTRLLHTLGPYSCNPKPKQRLVAFDGLQQMVRRRVRDVPLNSIEGNCIHSQRPWW